MRKQKTTHFLSHRQTNDVCSVLMHDSFVDLPFSSVCGSNNCDRRISDKGSVKKTLIVTARQGMRSEKIFTSQKITGITYTAQRIDDPLLIFTAGIF